MAYIEDGTSQNTKSLLRVGAYRKSARISMMPFGPAFGLSALTGTIAAALAVNSTVFAIRLSPITGSYRFYLTRMTLTYTTLTAFTTPITAGRRLAVFRGSGAQAGGGGTQLLAVTKKNNLDPNSRIQPSLGGDIKIANVGAITVTGITFDAVPIATMMLVDVGTAGASKTQIIEFDRAAGSNMLLAPGETLAVRNPQAMDAGGTWQLVVTLDWYEL